MDKIIETEGIGGRPLLCDHTGVSSKESQKHLTTPDVVRDVEKPPLLKKLSRSRDRKMSTKIENVVYRASERDEISANF